MKKILIISGIQIFPPLSGGQLRSANLARTLVKLGHNVEIYSYTGRKKDYLIGKKSSNNHVEKNLNEYTNRSLILGFIQHLFYKMNLPPVWLTWISHIYCPRYLQSKIHQNDSILLDFPYLYPLASKLKRNFKLNTHNAEFELVRGKSLFAQYLSKSVKKIELNCLKNAEQIFFCSENDMLKFAIFNSDIKTKSVIVPNGVNLPQFDLNKNKREITRKELNISNDQKVFLFTGSHYPPNSEVLHFLTDWNLKNQDELKKHNIVILIAGSVAKKAINEETIKATGSVENILPYLWASDFGLNPILEGSGTNVKMTEYLAAKLLILTTSFGTRGLNLKDKKTCFTFDRSELLSKMKEVLSLNEIQRNQMIHSALDDNTFAIDMKIALSNVNVNW